MASTMLPLWDPNMSKVFLGVAIGLSLALVCHWVAWAIH